MRIGVLFAVAGACVACGSGGSDESDKGGGRSRVQGCGDEPCLDVPDPTKGFQLHYGPLDADDLADVARFTLEPGGELTDCAFVESPNATAVHASGYTASFRVGVHSLGVYAPSDQRTLDGAPVTCSPSGSSPYLIDSVVPGAFAFAGSPAAPELEGAGLPVAARAPLALQVHAINEGDAPLVREAWVNLDTIDEGSVTSEVSAVGWMGGVGMNVMPHSKVTVAAGVAAKSQIVECVVPDEGDRRLLALRADVHAHTTRLAAFVQRGGAPERQKIYESFDWKNPFVASFNSRRTNPAPDTETRTPGAVSGEYVLHPGDRVSWECDVDNDTESSLRFADALFEGEACNAFGFQTSDRAWNCYSL